MVGFTVALCGPVRWGSLWLCAVWPRVCGRCGVRMLCVCVCGVHDGRVRMLCVCMCEKGGARGGPPLLWCAGGGVLLSHTLAGAVPSALAVLASGFGKGKVRACPCRCGRRHACRA